MIDDPLSRAIGQQQLKDVLVDPEFYDRAQMKKVTSKVLKGSALRTPAGRIAGIASLIFPGDKLSKISDRGIKKLKVIMNRLEGKSAKEIEEMKDIGFKKTRINKISKDAKDQGIEFPLSGIKARNVAKRQEAIEAIKKANREQKPLSLKQLAKNLGYKHETSIINLDLPVKLETPFQASKLKAVTDEFDKLISKKKLLTSDLAGLSTTIGKKLNVSKRTVSDALRAHEPYNKIYPLIKGINARGASLPKNTTLKDYTKQIKEDDYRLQLLRDKTARRRNVLSDISDVGKERLLAGTKRSGQEFHHADSKIFNATTKNTIYVEGRKNRGIIKTAENKINKLYKDRENLYREAAKTGRQPEGFVKKLMKINEEGVKTVDQPGVKGTLNFKILNPQTSSFYDYGVDMTKTLEGRIALGKNIADLTKEEIGLYRKFVRPKKNGGMIVDTYSDGTKLNKINSYLKGLS